MASFTPDLARWYNVEHPITPPPMTTTDAWGGSISLCEFTMSYLQLLEHFQAPRSPVFNFKSVNIINILTR
jgi:hypothetical protein